MKRTFANHIKQSLAVMCLVLGVFLFSTTGAQAQSVVGSGSDLNWKASAEAQQVLLDVITNLHGDPQVNVVGSQPYIQVYYFKGIFGRLSDGSSTYQSSKDALSIFAGSGFAVQQNTSGVVLNSTQQQALFQVAVGLLTD